MSGKQVILLTGDSLVEGVGDELEGGWANRLKNIINENYEIYIIGIGGQNVLDLDKRIDNELEQYKPKIVIFQIGVNDSRIRDSLNGKNEILPNKFKEKYLNILEKAKKFESVEKIAVVGLPRVDESLTHPYKPDKHYLNNQIEKYENLIREICNIEEIDFINISHRVKAGQSPSMLFDGIHPSSHGHQAILEEVFNYFQNNIKKEP